LKAGITEHEDAVWQQYRPGQATHAAEWQDYFAEGNGKGKSKHKQQRNEIHAAEASLLGGQACSFLHGSQAGPQQSTQQGYAITNQQGYIGDFALPIAEQTGETGQNNYPWWESTQKTIHAAAWYSRTRLGDVVGLLVDPGAHDNLVGDRTLASMSKQAGESAVLRPLASPMSVEGVGKSMQTAKQAGQVAVGVEGQVGTYIAPVIPDSDLPPLLGLRTLEGRQAILDVGNKRLIFQVQVGCTCS